ncbi:hypothetical protein [Bacillus sp. WP8]|uniref:hypothetical protein n=1 Tax=Bacillus sp. WP8 TaxID=756828 RepID=UPI0011A70785|nr:hypothetical protein [Bacillus sp. WP8]
MGGFNGGDKKGKEESNGGRRHGRGATVSCMERIIFCDVFLCERFCFWVEILCVFCVDGVLIGLFVEVFDVFGLGGRRFGKKKKRM